MMFSKRALIFLSILFAALLLGAFILFFKNGKGPSGRPSYKSPVVDMTVPLDFTKTGYITINNPGQKTGVMYLVYEQPGAPALFKELKIDEKSVCIGGFGKMPCMAMNIDWGSAFSGKRAEVKGITKSDVVVVRQLRVIDLPI
ncbi:MAG: hypothetical protein WCT49_03100 [Candidatus Paceibacterota bacterium]|jgi:hypothetical protein|nr:hypothetical protein [Candidatus Paceibacterota bacterium]